MKHCPFSKNQDEFLKKYNQLLKTSITQNRNFIQIIISFTFLSIIIFDLLFHIENIPFDQIIRDHKKKTDLLLIIGIFLFFNVLYIILYSINYNSKGMNFWGFRIFCENEIFLGFFFLLEFLILNYLFWKFKQNCEGLIFSKMMSIYVFVILQIFLRFALSLIYNAKYFADLKSYYDINKNKKTEIKEIKICSDLKEKVDLDFSQVTLYSEDLYISE